MLPPGLSRAERSLALAVLDGRTVVVNVRKGGPHKNLVPWLAETGRLTYVGHSGARHDWPESDFANPFVNMRDVDREAMVRRYREWLTEHSSLMPHPPPLPTSRAGELTGKALGCWCAPKPCHADVLAELSVQTGTLDSGGSEAAQ